MNSILRKAMLPAAVAVAMAGFIGAFGSGVSGVQNAYAIDGDICRVDVDSRAGTTHDGQGNSVYVVNKGTTYGLVYRVEDDANDHDNVTVRIDSETGSARITSKAEWLSGGENDADVGHILVSPPVGTQTVDTIDPDDFNDADGHALDNINAWLVDVGYPGFANAEDEALCGNTTVDDGWGFIDFECIESGYFHIDILAPGDTEETGMTVKFFCPGQADRAEIASQRSTLETQPTNVAPNGFGTSVITVTVWDQNNDRFDGAKVTFTTDNCTFKNTDPSGDNPISPAGGGTTVVTYSDTDTTADSNFLADNPLQDEAGTAEVLLDCTTSAAKPGTATVTAIVEREGADIVLKTTITVVGPTSATGLTLTLTPDDLECGETVLATAKAVDANGAPVSNGTIIYFTTDTSAGVVGGIEGAQGQNSTINGEASVLLATDPSKPGTHTVIAYVVNNAGTPSAQTSQTYVCDGAVAPAAPTVPAPQTGTGTGSITPPNTGNAGLATTSGSASLFVIAGAVAFVLAGLASVRFARN